MARFPLARTVFKASVCCNHQWEPAGRYVNHASSSEKAEKCTKCKAGCVRNAEGMIVNYVLPVKNYIQEWS